MRAASDDGDSNVAAGSLRSSLVLCRARLADEWLVWVQGIDQTPLHVPISVCRGHVQYILPTHIAQQHLAAQSEETYWVEVEVESFGALLQQHQVVGSTEHQSVR